MQPATRTGETASRGRRHAMQAGVLLLGLAGCHAGVGGEASPSVPAPSVRTYERQVPVSEVTRQLGALAVKGRAPKTGYDRDNFGAGWSKDEGCDTRNRILRRDLIHIQFAENGCTVLQGELHDPYTGKVRQFVRGNKTSDDVQIDHVVSLSNAWQTGAQQISARDRIFLANDPINLAAVEGTVNQQKGDGDAATWLPPDKSYRCSYVARQVIVKSEYDLWVTPAEHAAISDVLQDCPSEAVVVPK